MFLNAKAMSMFQEEISQLNVQQLKTGEKRWLGNLLGSSAALFIQTLSTQNKKLFVVVAKNNQHLAQLESEFEFYGIRPTIFQTGKFCLMIVYLLIKILYLSVSQFYPICRKQVSY